MADPTHRRAAMGEQDFLPDNPTLTLNPNRRTTGSTFAHVLESTRWNVSRSDGSTVARTAATAQPAGPRGGPAAQVAGPSYRLLQPIGRGGMGEVWEAEQTSLRRIVAVKQLRPARNEEEGGFLARAFREEAFTASQLDHPNIVPTYDIGEDEAGRPLLAMKLVRGTPWNRLIADDFPSMGAEEFLAKHIPILVSVTQAVAFAHSRGIVHRDLKPHQVVVGSYGEVYLMDWGLAVTFDARRLSESRGGAPALDLPTPVNASSPAGTLAYMAPEQAAKTAEGVGPWTDVYLLGATLYELLAGRPPRTGKPAKELWEDAAAGAYLPIAAAAAGRAVPDDLAHLAETAMQPRVADRAVTADEFLRRLKEHLSGAGRKRESLDLSSEANRILKQARTYREFGDAATMAGRALMLWPRNSEAEAALARAGEDFARAALRNGDLVLARTEAERLADSPARAGILEDVARAEQAAAAREVARRRAAYAIAALVAVIIAGGALFTRALSAERTEAYRQRDRAAANEKLAEERAQEADRERQVALRQLESAIQLSEFMLGDLSESLDLSVERDRVLAEKITANVTRQVDGMETESLSAESRARFASFLAEVGKHFADLGRTREAGRFGDAALAMAESSGLKGPGFVTLLLRLTESQFTTGRYSEALALADRTLEAGKAEGVGDSSMSTLVSLRGQALSKLGRRTESLAALEEAVALAGDGSKLEPGAAGALLVNYAEELKDAGRMDEAEQAYLRAVDIFRERGRPSVGYVGALNNLASFYAELGKNGQALGVMRSALAVCEKVRGPSHTDTASLMANLAGMLGAEGHNEEAESYFAKSLALIEAEKGASPRAYMRCRSVYASYLRKNGRRGEAEKILLDTLEEAAKAGLNASEDATALSFNLVHLYASQGRYGEAIPFMRRVVDFRRSVSGETHRHTVIARGSLAAILDNAGDRKGAIAEIEGIIASLRPLGREGDEMLIGKLVDLGIITSRDLQYERGEAALLEAIEALRAAGKRDTQLYRTAVFNLANNYAYRDLEAKAAPLRKELEDFAYEAMQADPAKRIEWLDARLSTAAVVRHIPERREEAFGMLRDVVAQVDAMPEGGGGTGQKIKAEALVYLERFDEAAQVIRAALDMELADSDRDRLILLGQKLGILEGGAESGK